MLSQLKNEGDPYESDSSLLLRWNANGGMQVSLRGKYLCCVVTSPCIAAHCYALDGNVVPTAMQPGRPAMSHTTETPSDTDRIEYHEIAISQLGLSR